MSRAAQDLRSSSELRKVWAKTKSLVRAKPGFFIVGGQKCGTTSLYSYLAKHPCVLPAKVKEIHFFSDHYQEGERWYRNHFAPLFDLYRRALRTRHRVITGEATPYYIFHPHAPQRIRRYRPDARIIMMLRNPVDRAFSHYRYHVKLGTEQLIFEQAIANESQRLEGEVEKMLRDERYFSFNHKNYSYLQRGLYLEQLQRWLAFFSREQILVLSSEEFFMDPAKSYAAVQEFLGLPKHELSNYKKLNEGGQDRMNPQTRAQLEEFFRPHNEKLYEFLGTDFGWNR